MDSTVKIRFLGMSSTLRSLGVAALLATWATHASATTYDFSYTLSSTNPAYNGDVVSGSFNGSPDVSIAGDIDISSVNSLSFAGVALTGPFTDWHYTDAGGACGNCYANGGAVASTTNPLNNNFVIINAAETTYFYIIPWPNGPQTEATQFNSPSTGYVDLYNGEFVPGNFSLTATPLPSTWTMLIAGFLGLGYFAYRGKKNGSASFAAA